MTEGQPDQHWAALQPHVPGCSAVNQIQWAGTPLRWGHCANALSEHGLIQACLLYQSNLHSLVEHLALCAFVFILCNLPVECCGRLLCVVTCFPKPTLRGVLNNIWLYWIVHQKVCSFQKLLGTQFRFNDSNKWSRNSEINAIQVSLIFQLQEKPIWSGVHCNYTFYLDLHWIWTSITQIKIDVSTGKQCSWMKSGDM